MLAKVFLLLIVASASLAISPCLDRTDEASFGKSKLLSKLGLGYDPTKAEYRHPVFTLTVGSGTYLDVGKGRVELPCEAQDSASELTVQKVHEMDQVVVSSDQLFTRDMEKDALGAGETNFMLSLGLTRDEATEKRLSSAFVMRYRALALARVELPVSGSEVAKMEAMEWWSAEFGKALDRLSTDISDPSYDDLFEAFGTHVLVGVELGGFIAEYARVKSCELATLQMGASASGSIKEELLNELDEEVKYELHVSKKEPPQEDDIERAVIFRAGGEESVLQRTGSVDKYIETVKKFGKPAILSEGSQFVPIWALLNGSEPMQERLRAATEAYVLENRNGTGFLDLSTPQPGVQPCTIKKKDSNHSGGLSTNEITIIAGTLGGLLLIACVFVVWRCKPTSGKYSKNKGYLDDDSSALLLMSSDLA